MSDSASKIKFPHLQERQPDLSLMSIGFTTYQGVIQEYITDKILLIRELRTGQLKLRIRGQFKQLVKSGNPTQYLVIKCLKGDKEIHARDVYRYKGSVAKVVLADDAGKSLRLELPQDEEGAKAWTLAKEWDCVGFYYDGNTEYLPDFVSSYINKSDPKPVLERNILKFPEPLPQALLTALREGRDDMKCMVHYSTSTHVYPVVVKLEQGEVHKFDITVSDTRWQGTTALRPDATHYKIGFLLNYGGSAHDVVGIAGFKAEYVFE